MLWLNDAVIELARQGVPIVASIVGAGIGAERAASKGKSTWPRVAGYAGLGWFAGYVTRSVLLRVLEGRGRALPTETVSMPDAPSAEPEPPMTTMGPTEGLYTPPSRPAGEVDATSAPSPGPTKTPKMQASGEVIKIQGTINQNSMGSVYGG